MIYISARQNETLSEIIAFYESCGYFGGAKEEDQIFLAKDQDQIVGVVRVAIENSYPLLRGMFIADSYQGKGLGSKMLPFVANFLDSQTNISFCIPHDNLEKFYGQIDFMLADDSEAPDFLAQRMKDYREQGYNVFLMKRIPKI